MSFECGLNKMQTFVSGVETCLYSQGERDLRDVFRAHEKGLRTPAEASPADCFVVVLDLPVADDLCVFRSTRRLWRQRRR